MPPFDGVLTLRDDGYAATPREAIGVANLPDQLVRDATNDGFVFNFMVLGEPSVGKKSLVETLLGVSLKDFQELPPSSNEGPRVLQYAAVLREGAVKCCVRVYVVADIGAQLDKTGTDTVVLQTVLGQFEAFLEAELRATRPSTSTDTRVHACVYMVSPTGREVKESDVLMMKAIHSRVNLVPVIAKADGLSVSELATFRTSIRSTLEHHGVHVYMPKDPECKGTYEASFPLAVVASRDVVVVGGTSMRVRQYPWGMVEVENPKHSQVGLLRDVIFRDCTLDLVQSTHETKYEAFRKLKLVKMGFADSDADGKPVRVGDALDAKRREIDDGHDAIVRDLRQKYVRMAKEKAAQYMEARKGLSEKYSRLMEIHRNEQQGYQRSMAELDAEREAWRSTMHKEKEKGRKSK